MIHNNFDYKTIQEAALKSKTIAEFLNELGIEKNKGGYRKAHMLAEHFGVILNKSQGSNGISTSKLRLSNDSFFVKGFHRGGERIRKRLIALGKEYKCDIPDCPTLGMELWLGKEIVFQVDHINGDNFDNRVDNLRFICPICHTQTETYGSKNRISKRVSISENAQSRVCECGNNKSYSSKNCLECKNRNYIPKVKIIWPPVDEVIENIKLIGYSPYSRILGVTDNAVRKYLVRSGVNPLPNKN